MRQFYVQRHDDIHGNTGTGIVAEGVIFKSGKAVMQWLDPIASVVTFDSIDHIEKIHGHGGKTVVVIGQSPARRNVKRDTLTPLRPRYFALLLIALLLLTFSIARAQYDDVKVLSRVTNYARIAKAWNALIPATEKWNRAMGIANESIHAHRPDKVNNEEETRKRVAQYKIAREATIEELKALEILIIEEGGE
jgi:hypothetical protein